MTQAAPPASSAHPDTDLEALRVDIDRIDAAMHDLLIERSGIIDRLIAIKARQGGGSAFRPGREADMMRRIAERHRGRLPLETVESIWRVIISTFTYMQANYAVHADMAAGDAAMRDCARFHFGFTVPLSSHFGPDGVIRAVAEAVCDLGLIPIGGQSSRGPWWRALAEPGGPKIIARLPFIERPDHPAGMPVFVVARPVAASAARDVVLRTVDLERWSDPLSLRMVELDSAVVARSPFAGGETLLVASPGHVAPDRIGQAFDGASLREVGSHAARFGIA